MADQLDVEPWVFGHFETGTRVEVTADHIRFARQLVEDGWYQTSRRHRHVARLPDGMTGVEALARAERFSNLPFRCTDEDIAGEAYLSRHAAHELNRCELDIPTFAAFKKVGGDRYQHRNRNLRRRAA